jgi:hypothetical protein
MPSPGGAKTFLNTTEEEFLLILPGAAPLLHYPVTGDDDVGQIMLVFILHCMTIVKCPPGID